MCWEGSTIINVLPELQQNNIKELKNAKSKMVSFFKVFGFLNWNLSQSLLLEANSMKPNLTVNGPISVK